MAYFDSFIIDGTERELRDSKAAANFAPAYSTSGTYAVGDVVTYDGALYKCSTAIASGEAWTAAHWTATTVSGEAKASADSRAPAIRVTASGPVAHFTDAVAAPMALDIEIKPNQAGSGDPSPTNVRAITGHTSVTVSRSGADTSDADEFEITLPAGAGTVYGGNLHINQDGSGVLTVDRAIITIGSKTWSYYSGANNTVRFSTTVSDLKEYASARRTPFVCSAFTCIDDGTGIVNTGDNITDNVIYGGSGTNKDRIFIICRSYTDADAFASAFENETIVYPLAESTTYNLTAAQISSLFGENNVWANAGGVTAEYTADTKTYIEHLTQPDQDWIADAGISIGKFFMVGNELYVATSGIAAGETIVPGTNCTKKSLAAALNDINA